jgi:hypothetical protein
MAKIVFVVSTCDIHKFKDSYRLAGILTSRTQLNKALNQMLIDDEIEWGNGLPKTTTVNSYTLVELDTMLRYVHIGHVEVNKRQ